MKRTFSMIGWAVALAGLSSAEPVLLRAQTTAVGEVAADFTVTRFDNGAPLKLSEFAGRVVVLDFFRWW